MQRTKTQKTFGERIREARKKRNMTDIDLARELNCSPSMIRMIETDRAQPQKPSVANRAAKFLGVPL